MELLADLDKIYSCMQSFILIMTRIVVLLLTFNVFRRGMASAKMLASLAAILSLYVVLLSHQQVDKSGVLSLSYFMQSISQVLLGFIGGLILNLAMEVITIVGQIISTQLGLSAASLFDPRFGMITSMTNFYIITFIILFFMMDGPFVIIKTVVDSFEYLPVNRVIFDYKGLEVVQFAGIIFTGSIMMVISLMAAILMVNLSLSIMSKFAPQFNLFSIGLNISIIVGLICVYFSFEMLADKTHDNVATVLNYYANYFKELVPYVR